ncbi:MAG: MBL fold metallo-hydrolase [Dehalococcoidia bacterium]|nr:MBL fold metallo-hydrolase [Dehalococcoidia bacterium]MDW8119258.1 MBL fold metallo-hydrolase [Chloroflexota bacterium]
MPTPLVPPNGPRIEVLREGDGQGNGALLRLHFPSGLVVHTAAIPQDWPSPTGPTWVYALEGEGLTLIDAGALGSAEVVVQGLRDLGLAPHAVRRIVVTHGHPDHDGAAGTLARLLDAQVWTHPLYAYLLHFDTWQIARRGNSLARQSLRAFFSQDVSPRSHDTTLQFQRHQRYLEARRSTVVAATLQDGQQWGGMTFYHTPGHSPDEISVLVGGVLFTGDHVLPEITPHPTVLTSYPPEVLQRLPPEWHRTGEHYGLATYLRSLFRVLALGEDLLVLPAHRLLRRGRLNLLTTARAREIVEHHRQRLQRILSLVAEGKQTVEAVTRALFTPRQLADGNIWPAVTEVVAHVEFLAQAGDIEVLPDGRLRATGMEEFSRAVDRLASPAP